MIEIYGATERSFTAPLINCIPNKALIVKDEDDYYLDLEVPIDHITPHGIAIDYKPYLIQDNIVYCETPWDSWQPFRLNNMTYTSRVARSRAYHVGLDSKRFVLASKTVTDIIQAAVATALNEAAASTYFTQVVTGTTYSKQYDFGNWTLFQALQYIKSRNTGFMLDFNNWQIIFTDAVTTYTYDGIIQDAVNLKNIEITENWDNVTSRMLPLGRADLKLPYKYVNSPNTFAVPYGRIKKYNTDDESELGLLASGDILDLNVPEINYKIDAEIKVPINIGDIIPVKHSRLGVDITTNVISLEYDTLTKRYKKVEFGNFKPRIKGFATNIDSNMQNITTRLEKGGL